MKIAFLFPGQGAQEIGMGKDIYENFEEARNMYKYVQDITKMDVAKMTFEGDETELNKTNNTQICILTMSLAILEILKKHNIEANISSGLSLGEYTALIYSGYIDLKEGIELVKKRGELMQNLVPAGKWSMAAIMGLENNKVEEICNSVKSGFVTPANYNYVGQIVISGEEKAVEEAIEKAKEAGCKKAVQLKTSGPFHTIKLKEASEELSKELKKININNSEITVGASIAHPSNKKIQVIKNIDGKPYTEQDDIKEILKKHIISPVHFDETINTMLEMGIDTFIEIGPGKTLAGFIKRTNKEVKVLNINNLASLEETLNYLKI